MSIDELRDLQKGIEEQYNNLSDHAWIADMLKHLKVKYDTIGDIISKLERESKMPLKYSTKLQRLKTVRQRFEEKIIKSDSCWDWLGGKNSSTGYSMFSPKHGTNNGAHRYSYELYKGKIPEGLQLDHLCRNRWCINPEHLEPVTIKENLLRGIGGFNGVNSTKIHCDHGHEFTKDNTYIKPNGSRSCRICRNNAHKQYLLRKRGYSLATTPTN